MTFDALGSTATAFTNVSRVSGSLALLQRLPLSVLLNTPWVVVPAYNVAGVCGSMANVLTTRLEPALFHDTPLSVLLNTPRAVPAYSTRGVAGSMTNAVTNVGRSAARARQLAD